MGKIGSICEIPLYGTASIHIGANPQDSENLLQEYPDAKPMEVKNKVPSNPNNIQIFRDGKRIVAPNKATGKTVTMTIYGSIATNPVLPCCKCC